MQESSEHPVRPKGFTPTQELQAQYIGRVTPTHRNARREIPTFPIDNVGPEIVADRDDGVFVEAETLGGGYRVHVTIADVAAHVRVGSPLEKAAWQRAFTLYGPGWTDPMFPKILEETLSLEHQQERLGLTVSITLDQHFNPIHTSFTPVITHPDNSSYAQAQERMQSDPQFQLMGKIAQGIKAEHFGGQTVDWQEMFSKRQSRVALSSSEIAAMEMVATYMLLANNCVAEFFSRTGLPFMYRNFDPQSADSHAWYGTEPKRHSALEGMGLKGSYCHFTSPIRRAPDYYNGIMVHYAISSLGAIEKALLKAEPQLEVKPLRHELWQHGPAIMAALNPASSQRLPQRKAALKALLTDISRAASPTKQPLAQRTLTHVVSKLDVPALPLTVPQLDEYAAHINGLSHAPMMREMEKQNEKYERHHEQIDALEQLSDTQLAAMSAERFSSVLAAAAATGKMPRPLFDEATERLKTDRYDKVRDAASIFLVAHYPGVQRWTALKRQVARAIKHDPSTVNALIEKLERLIEPARIEVLDTELPGSKSADAGKEPTFIHGSLLVMHTPDEPDIAPPFYSVGHDKRAALSHARYSFLEHFAFGQLQSLDQTSMPNVLYAELDMDGAKKRELLERMVLGMGGTLSVSERMNANGYHTEVVVSGGELVTPIRVESQEATREEATETALRRTLRHTSFKIAVSDHEAIAREELNPQDVLSDVVNARGGTLQLRPIESSTRGLPKHTVEAQVIINGKPMKFVASGPNIDRAKRMAAANALEYLGWPVDDAQKPAKSWVSKESRPLDRAWGYGKLARLSGDP